MRKVFILSLLGSLASLLFWLFSASSCAGSHYNVIYEKVDFIAIKNNQNVGIDTLSTIDTVSIDKLYLQLFVVPHYFLVNNTNPFINTALAFQPGADQYKVLETIEDISIRTVNDFDAQHPAGSEIWDLLAGNSANPTVKQEILGSINRQQDIDGFAKYFGMRFLKTTDFPDQLQQFVVEIITDKNSVLRAKTNQFYMQ